MTSPTSVIGDVVLEKQFLSILILYRLCYYYAGKVEAYFPSRIIMLYPSRQSLILYFLSFGAFVNGNGQLGDSKLNERPYVVLQNQNLVVLISVLSILLVVMIVMAVCVYKPLHRR